MAPPAKNPPDPHQPKDRDDDAHQNTGTAEDAEDMGADSGADGGADGPDD